MVHATKTKIMWKLEDGDLSDIFWVVVKLNINGKEGKNLEDTPKEERIVDFR